MGRIDTSLVHEEDSLLLNAAASSYSDENKMMDMIRLCVRSGLPTFQRKETANINAFKQNTGFSYQPEIHCPLFQLLEQSKLRAAALLLRSGAVSHRALLAALEAGRNLDPGERRRRIYIPRAFTRFRRAPVVVEALSGPGRLEHLARLAVSHQVGCRPGRAARVSGLPVPQAIKDLVNFEDVLSRDPEADDFWQVEGSEDSS